MFSFISRLIVLVLILMVCAGCATRTIKVIDGHGNAVSGALVISEQDPYILTPWKQGVYITDENGEARIIGNRGYILKEGFFAPNSSSINNNHLFWSEDLSFSEVNIIKNINYYENITCINEMDFGMRFFYSNKHGNPKIYLSSNLMDNIDTYRKAIPCSDIYFDILFENIKKVIQYEN